MKTVPILRYPLLSWIHYFHNNDNNNGNDSDSENDNEYNDDDEHIIVVIIIFFKLNKVPYPLGKMLKMLGYTYKL